MRKFNVSISVVTLKVLFFIYSTFIIATPAAVAWEILGLPYYTSPLVNINESTIELVANISYELTFLIAAIICLIFLIIKKSKTNKETVKNNLLAAVLETAGQFFYVYALSGNAIVAAPMIASYSIVSMILSRIFLKEKLTKKEYIALFIIIIGIIVLGVVEEL